MSDEYPSDEQLEQIEEWPESDPTGWFAFIKVSGNYWPSESWGWAERDDEDEIDKAVRVYEVSTGGWSGNEDIIDAMQHNRALWHLTWHQTRRGGHYTFMVKRAASPDVGRA